MHVRVLRFHWIGAVLTFLIYPVFVSKMAIAYELNLLIITITVGLLIPSGQSILCYRCDSLVESDCPSYPSATSVYEDCDAKPQKTHKEHYETLDFHKTGRQTPLKDDDHVVYLRHRFTVCPVSLKEFIPAGLCGQTDKNNSSSSQSSGYFTTPSPLENANYVCGKAVTRDPNGNNARVRRGCTPDLFLSGTDACASTPSECHGCATQIACFCTTDLCNHGSSLRHLPLNKGYIVISLFICFTSISPYFY